MIKLEESKVVFDEVSHTYTYNGKELSGITSIISKYLFPDKYAGVSESVLNKKKEHGSLVHNQLQMLVLGLPFADEVAETIACKQLFADNGIVPMCGEYLVSDSLHVATSIDMVDEQLNLYDYKTTSKLDKEYLRWQLSICAYLFELQNPHIKVGKLFAIHLVKDSARLVEIPRLPETYVTSLLTAFIIGSDTFTNPREIASAEEQEVMKQYIEAERDLVIARLEVERLEKIQERCLEKIRTMMDETGDDVLERSEYSVTYTRPTQVRQHSYDMEKLSAENPDWDIAKYQVEKIVNRKAVMKVKLNN